MNYRLRNISVAALALLISPATGLGQAGDAKDNPNQVQAEIWRDMDVPPAPVVSPEASLDKFTIQEGYSLEIVASEPLVNDPVAVTWDEFGRLWVAEMWAYMPNVDGEGEDEPVSRVIVLEDTDQDGVMDRSTVFLDKLVLPRAVAIVEGGVLIADPPNLLFCEDLDGDLISDKETKIATYADVGNVEHSENGLMRGIDNWYYNAKSKRRFKLEDGEIKFETTNFRGQWGITQDDFGRLYYNTNSFYLYGDTVPWEYVSNHPGWSPKAGISEEVVPDKTIYTNRVNPGINRAYREGRLRPDNRMVEVDAISAPAIARGDRYPEDVQGNVFIPEPAGNAVSRFQLQDNGLKVESEKVLQTDEKWGKVEFLASTDERFRPVATALGPDGFMYVVDMYRGILQHKDYLTSFLRKQIIERGLDNPVGLGRIYRIVHESDSPSRSTPQLGTLEQAELIQRLGDENGWVRDTAQRLLIQKGNLSKADLEKLKSLATSGSELERIHALWTLEGLNEIDDKTLIETYNDGSNWTKTHALRVAAPLLENAINTKSKLGKLYLFSLQEPSDRVRLQAIQLLGATGSPEFMIDAIDGLSPEDLSNPYFIDASVSNLHGHEPEFIAKSLKSNSSGILATLIESLAYATFAAGDSHGAEKIISLSQSEGANPNLVSAISNGLLEAYQDSNSQALAIATNPFEDPSQESPLYDAFTWPEKPNDNALVYTDEQLASINRGKPVYENLCAICHRIDGKGIPSLAPGLAGTEWVNGSKKRLALIVGHGLTGPIEVAGKRWDSSMPAHGSHPMLDGEAFGDVLNYIRSAWGNNEELFEQGEARAYLNEMPDRNDQWTVQELDDLLDKND